MSGPLDHARMLLRKAANDLVAADATLPAGAAFDTVCFHAQQAVEKSLKALLAVHDVCYPWTHDLVELLQVVTPHRPAVREFAAAIEDLTTYAVTVRHDEAVDPTPSDARAAVNVARQVHCLAESLVAGQSVASPPPSAGDVPPG